MRKQLQLRTVYIYFLNAFWSKVFCPNLQRFSFFKADIPMHTIYRHGNCVSCCIELDKTFVYS